MQADLEGVPTENAFHGACNGCGAELTVALSQRTTICPYCDTPTIFEKPATADNPTPVFVLGFAVTKQQAVETVRNWMGAKAFWAHRGFAQSTLEKTRGVYVPAYLYGAELQSRYSVQIGEHYSETRTHTDSEGRSTTRTTTETEWRSLSGIHAMNVTETIVTASRGIANAALENVEPFDLRALTRYDPAMISGWYAEDASMIREECVALARQEALHSVGVRLKDFMPGDTQRGLQYDCEFTNEHIEPILVPVWIFAARYREDKPPLQILVNGQSRRLFGKVPYSGLKITSAVILILLILAAAGFFLWQT